jgi:hypothetical protein
MDVLLANLGTRGVNPKPPASRPDPAIRSSPDHPCVSGRAWHKAIIAAERLDRGAAGLEPAAIGAETANPGETSFGEATVASCLIGRR